MAVAGMGRVLIFKAIKITVVFENITIILKLDQCFINFTLI
jgi:hypothetical protein